MYWENKNKYLNDIRESRCESRNQTHRDTCRRESQSGMKWNQHIKMKEVEMKYTSTPEKSSVGSLSNRTNPMENRASGPKGTECSVKSSEKFKQTNEWYRTLRVSWKDWRHQRRKFLNSRGRDPHLGVSFRTQMKCKIDRTRKNSSQHITIKALRT